MHFNKSTKTLALVAFFGLTSSYSLPPAEDIALSTRQQPTKLPYSLEVKGCQCTGQALYSFRSANVTLFDENGKSLANIAGTCSSYKEGSHGSGCALLEFNDISIGGYLIEHPDVYFGACGYVKGNVTVSIPVAHGPIHGENLVVSCVSKTDSCEPFKDICGGSITASTMTAVRAKL